MKLTETKKYILEDAIRITANNIGVDINTMPRSSSEEPMQWGVNWSAFGTATPQEAIDYAHKITKAAEAVKCLNRLKVEYHTTEDTEAEKVMTPGRYNELVKDYASALECNTLDKMLMD